MKENVSGVTDGECKNLQDTALDMFVFLPVAFLAEPIPSQDISIPSASYIMLPN